MNPINTTKESDSAKMAEVITLPWPNLREDYELLEVIGEYLLVKYSIC